ncbi:hypothetical protein F4813DRAFT_392340 [Daldinia decipiens]|uniref:uncharacterized protein n=1 Tax=Daldinia decipiens TaxID=326647 RepID=UPI0020C497EA|nr:uncharacterized protein F4813DRAFT_392340 [Daldinia decipiens]KAI1654828.1 hypothetical protein F4813DRAFT_392340 [Daldinia decipiens]
MDVLCRKLYDCNINFTPSNSIEELFRNLGDPLDNDKNCYSSIDELDTKYRRVLQDFLKKAASSPPNHPYISTFITVAHQVLACNHGIHVAFVERLAHMVVHTGTYYPGPYEQDFFSACKWIYQGRKIQDLAALNMEADHSGDKNGRGDNDGTDNSSIADGRSDFRRVANRSSNYNEIAEGKRDNGGDTTSIVSNSRSDNFPDDNGSDGNDRGDNDRSSNDRLDIYEASLVPNSYNSYNSHNSHNSPASPTRQCARCGISNLFLTCGNCLLKRGAQITMSTVYCSQRCQELDWPVHKLSCWEERGMTMLKEHKPYILAMLGCYMTRPFPFGGFSTEQHARMVQSDQYVREMMYLIGPLKAFFLDDLCQDFKIVTILAKNADRPLCRKSENNIEKSSMMDPHSVLRLTLPSGEKFAVDLAAGRFGWVEKMMHWNRFEEERIWKIIEITCTIPLDFRDPYIPAAQSILIHKEILADLMGHINFRIHFGTDRWSTTLDILTRVDTEEFSDWQSDLLERAIDLCEETFTIRLSNHRGYMYLTPEFDLCVTAEGADYDAIQSAWMTEEEVIRLEGEREELLKGV